jgi:predicted Zn-dependent protease
MRRLPVPTRVLTSLALSICWILLGCTIQSKIPTIVDNRVESVLRDEARSILKVSEDRDKPLRYEFRLSEFPRKDILGMSVGDGRIYISYKLATLALHDPSHLWLLRQTVAHEIAHETAGHANREGGMWFNRAPFAWGASGREVGLPWYVRFYNYSTEKELEADRIGLAYWNKLGWDCRIWVEILENFEDQGYRGDTFHPTPGRLLQARKFCDDRPKGRPQVLQ